MNPKIIAYYLPQYHPFKENNEWWGNGFTEWTNVGKAKPLFKGHDQPKVPADLGYYDLRYAPIREEQVKLAKEAGIEGFMYWHYWFGNGKRLMETVFDEVLETGKPDFPFCLGWANHSWYAKNWNTSSTKGADKLLIEQKYFGIEDYRMHYEYCIKAFKDERYIKVNDAPVYLIFDVNTLPIDFINNWNNWAKEDGFKNGIYFIATISSNKYDNFANIDLWIKKGYSAVVVQRIDDIFKKNFKNKVYSVIVREIRRALKYPARYVKYEDVINYLVNPIQEIREDCIPVIIPNYDHSPRSKYQAYVMDGVTPKLFEKHVSQIFELIKRKENKLVFLRSWNEWGEGNYLEPDIVNGKKYIESLKKIVERFSKSF